MNTNLRTLNKLLRNIFVKNWGLKLFSFLFALVFWFTIIPEEKLSFEISVPVSLELYNTPAGLEIIEGPLPIVVTIKAPRRDLNHGLVEFHGIDAGGADPVAFQKDQSTGNGGSLVSVEIGLCFGNVEGVSCSDFEEVTVKVVKDVARLKHGCTSNGKKAVLFLPATLKIIPPIAS